MTGGDAIAARTLHVLVVSSELAPGGYGSGIALATFVAAASRHTAWSMKVVAPASRRSGGSVAGLERVRVVLVPTCEDAAGVRHVRRRVVQFPVRSVVQACRREFRPDVILSWQALPAGPAGVAAARFLGVPHVSRLHGPELLARRRGSRAVVRAAVRAVVDRSALVVAKSPQEADALVCYGYRGQTHVVPNAPHPRFGSLSHHPGWREPSRPVRLLVVSRLVQHKRVGLALEALEVLQRRQPGAFRLTVVGDGPLRSPLEALAAAKRLPAVFAGRLPHDQMPRIYREHDVVVHPSEHEGSCNAGLEALACGVPVVGCRSALHDVVRHGVDGVLLDDADGSSIADTLMRADVERLQSAVRRSRKTAADERLAKGYARALSFALDHG